MIRFLVTFVLVGFAAADCTVGNAPARIECDVKPATVEFPSEVCRESTCTTAIKEHIKEEFNAAFLYLYMGAIFAQDSVARPGIAKFMLESATEERSHANLMLDYLNKRGIQLTKADLDFKFSQANITDALTSMNAEDTMTMQSALKMALKMEISVTSLIIKVIESCECDYHAADVFTDPILDEQHDGIRKLQGVIREFEDMLSGHPEHDQQRGMVDFIMDQKILKGGL